FATHARAQTAPGGASTSKVAVPTELLAVTPGGITADAVGARAATTSYSARAAEQTLQSAAARVDQAWSGFLPRLTGTARYTRVSAFPPPSFGPPGLGLVVTPAPAGLVPADAPLVSSGPGALDFPLILDNYLLQANITVPISDYFLRISQNYTAA